MMETIRNYLSCAGIQYRNPDKSGDEREKMLELRHKGQEARKAFTNLAKDFQASHQNGNFNRLNSGWIRRSVSTTFLGLSTERGQVTEPMLALRLYGKPSDFGISLEVSFIERKKDEQTLDKQAKVLELPVVEGNFII